MDFTETEEQIIMALRELKAIKRKKDNGIKSNGSRETELVNIVRGLSLDLTGDRWELIEKEVYSVE